jgi:hypothetical protein
MAVVRLFSWDVSADAVGLFEISGCPGSVTDADEALTFRAALLRGAEPDRQRTDSIPIRLCRALRESSDRCVADAWTAVGRALRERAGVPPIRALLGVGILLYSGGQPPCI